MAEQEFQESDIIFQENVGEDDDHIRIKYHDHRPDLFSDNKKKLKRKKNKENGKSSLPVSIPENASVNSTWFRYVDSDDLLDDNDILVSPPHVILGRRMNGKMAFSVCTGNGRTLKGRDLSHVRNSVLRMTGFLES